MDGYFFEWIKVDYMKLYSNGVAPFCHVSNMVRSLNSIPHSYCYFHVIQYVL